MNMTVEKMQVSLLLFCSVRADHEMLRTVFECEYQIEEASSNAQALQILRSKAIAAVLCDIPEDTEFLEQMRRDKDLPQLLVFAVTAGDADSQIRALDLGVENVITKPIQPRLAYAQVKNALENRWNQFDSLTGLCGSDTFSREAARLIMEKPAGTYLLACFDVDNFKAINAQHGRKTGDYVLKQIAKVVEDYADTYHGMACRMSADNFALLLPSDTPALLSKLMSSVEDRFKAEGVHIKIQLSIGRYRIDDKDLSFGDMINNALLAKSTVKGRYNVSVANYSHEMQERFMRELRIVSQMDYALAEGQFEVWLQPQYNHETGAMTGVEALTRWRSTEPESLIPPDMFIPIFERNGFIYELDKYIWEQVCRLLRRWIDEETVVLPVSVNVSRRDIFQEDFFEKLTGLIEKYRIPASLLQLEITESAFSFDTKRIVEMVKKLRGYGFTVEIDDFGSGYSSFNVLKDVPADVLKLDMRFLSGEDNTGRGGNIIESIVRMAKWIGMRIIAEGVETREQADFLRSIGCVFVQGYFYDRPMPIAEFEKLPKRKEKTKAADMFEMINALDSNAFWSPESIESLIFNSYVGGACVVEFTEGKGEIIRANEKYRQELRTEMLLTEILRTDFFAFMTGEHARRIQSEVRCAAQDDLELRGEVTFSFRPFEHDHEEYLRYYGRVIAKGPIRSVVYLLFENITQQKQVQQQAAEMTGQLRFLNEISKGLLSNPDTKAAIESLMQRQMAYFDAGRVYVLEFDETSQTGSVSYMICADGLAETVDAGRLISYATMPTWLDTLKSGRQIVIEDANTLSDDRSAEKRRLLAENITSLIAVPLRRNGVLIGMLVVDKPRRALNHVGHLAALGDYVAVLINRRDLLTKIENDNQAMERLMNDTPGGFVRMKMTPEGGAVPVFINDGFCRMMGMTHDEAVKLYSENAYAGLHPDDLAEVMPTVMKAMREDSIFSARLRFYHKEKGYLHFQAFYRMSTDSNGDQYSNGYYADMTAAVELDERRKELLDHLPCGAAVYELKNGVLNVRHVNKYFMELVGRREEQIHTENSITAIHPDDHVRVRSAIKEAVAAGWMSCDFRVLRGDGSFLPMHVVGKTEVQEDGSYLIYTTFTPISEETLSVSTALADQHRAEELAQEANEQLRFLNDTSRYLLMSKDPDEAIYQALQKIMEHFDGERSYIFELNDEKQESSNTYEVCAPGIVSQKSHLQCLPYGMQRFVLGKFRSGQNICIEDVEEMPEEGGNERLLLERQGIRNVFLVPLKSDGMLIGYAGVDNPKRNTRHVNQLVAISDYMAAMLIRRNHVRHIEKDNELMQRLMNDTPGGFVRTRVYPDGLTVPLFINDGFCEMTGMAKEEAMDMYSKDSLSGVHPDDIPVLLQTIERALREDFTVSVRIRFLHKEKGYILLQVFYRITTDADGAKYSNAYYADMTESTLLEERRKELLDNLPCGAIVFEFTQDGILNASHINKRYAELVNRSGGELQMQDSIQAVHPKDRERMMDTIREGIREDQELECDIRVLKGGGGYTAFHFVGRIVSRENENTILYTTYTPITEETRSLSAALSDQRKAEKLAQETTEQLHFLNDVSQYLLMRNAPGQAILLSLKRILEYFDGDRAYIFEMDDEKQISHNTYEYCAAGVTSEKVNLQNVPYATQEYVLRVFKGKGNVCIEDTVELARSGIDEKQIITSQGIHSLLLVPMWIGEKLTGFMGVDNPRRNISHIDQLAALGDYMATMILRRNNEAQILIDNRIMQDLMNDMPGGFVQMKMYPDGQIEPVFINEEFCRMSGMSHEQCVEHYGRNAYTGLHPGDQEMVRIALTDLIEKRNTCTLRLRLSKGDGSYVPMQVFYRVTDDNAGNLYLNGYYTDLTEQIALEEREMAEHDELTSLFNRTKLAHMRKGEYQTLTSCGILFFDVNHLKVVNDTQGHEKGDELLCLVAESIRSITGRRIHGYRYGGDEFLVVVCDGKKSELVRLVELWRARMDMLSEDKEMTASAAVGMAWSDAPVSLDNLIQKADKAMYADKQKNKRSLE